MKSSNEKKKHWNNIKWIRSNILKVILIKYMEIYDRWVFVKKKYNVLETIIYNILKFN